MLASYFVADGADAVLHPAAHVEKFRKVQPLLERAGVPPVLASDAAMLSRLMGAVSAAAGTCLALGKYPRSAALTLAAINIPITVINFPVWTASDGADRKEKLRGLLRGLGMGGGLLLAAADRDGKPSLSWRYQNFLEQRAKEHKAGLLSRA